MIDGPRNRSLPNPSATISIGMASSRLRLTANSVRALPSTRRRGRRKADPVLPSRRVLPEARVQGVCCDGQQHLQQLALRGPLARQINSFPNLQVPHYESIAPRGLAGAAISPLARAILGLQPSTGDQTVEAPHNEHAMPCPSWLERLASAAAESKMEPH